MNSDAFTERCAYCRAFEQRCDPLFLKKNGQITSWMATILWTELHEIESAALCFHALPVYLYMSPMLRWQVRPGPGADCWQCPPSATSSSLIVVVYPWWFNPLWVNNIRWAIVKPEIIKLITACGEGESPGLDWPTPTTNGCVCIQLQHMPRHLPHQRHVCLVPGPLRTIRLISIPVHVPACVCPNAHASSFRF